MAGKLQGKPTEANDKCYLENLKYAAKLLEKEKMVALIEPINEYSVPNYYMNSYKKGKMQFHLHKFININSLQLFLLLKVLTALI